MLILVIPLVLFVRHPRFIIAAYRRINRFLQYLLEIGGGGGEDFAKRGLSVPSPKKITLACVACQYVLDCSHLDTIIIYMYILYKQ